MKRKTAGSRPDCSKREYEVSEAIAYVYESCLAATPSEPMLQGNNTPWGVGGIESFSEGEEPPDDEPESDDHKVEEGQVMLDRIRGTLQARAEGRNEGGDIEVMKAVDAIVARERELADKLAKALRHMICGEDCDGCADNRAVLALYDAARK